MHETDCTTCASHYGQYNQGRYLHCAMHPYGPETDPCPDWTAKQPPDYSAVAASIGEMEAAAARIGEAATPILGGISSAMEELARAAAAISAGHTQTVSQAVERAARVSRVTGCSIGEAIEVISHWQGTWEELDHGLSSGRLVLRDGQLVSRDSQCVANDLPSGALDMQWAMCGMLGIDHTRLYAAIAEFRSRWPEQGSYLEALRYLYQLALRGEIIYRAQPYPRFERLRPASIQADAESNQIAADQIRFEGDLFRAFRRCGHPAEEFFWVAIPAAPSGKFRLEIRHGYSSLRIRSECNQAEMQLLADDRDLFMALMAQQLYQQAIEALRDPEAIGSDE